MAEVKFTRGDRVRLRDHGRIGVVTRQAISNTHVIVDFGAWKACYRHEELEPTSKGD